MIDTNSSEWMAKVAAAVTGLGLNAEPYHSGGGILVVLIPLQKGCEMMWGVAGEMWGYDLNDAEGRYLDHSGWADVPSDSTDLDQIAQAIVRVTSNLEFSNLPEQIDPESGRA